MKINATDLNDKYTKKSILVVEDNRVNQLLITKLLNNLGIEVSLSADGQDAITNVCNNSYDAILMDIELPVKDGISATKEIRDKKLSSIPIIALSAHNDNDIQKKCKQAGMNGYLTKPIDKLKLKKTLDRFLL